MKHILTTALCLLAGVTLWAQSAELPNTSIKDLKTGRKVAFNSIVTPGKVTVISFWATWCVPCKKEIKNFNEKLPAWQKDTDFEYITVSMDESKAEGLARSYAKSQGWGFNYFIDPNNDLKRSMNFQNVPYTIIIDKDGKVVWSHSGYEEGGEEIVMNKVRELTK